MVYSVRFTQRFDKQFSKLDKQAQKLIFAWLNKHVHGSLNPRIYGKSLTGYRSGQWRYRIGDYRVLCQIQDDKMIVLALEVGHRKNIYA